MLKALKTKISIPFTSLFYKTLQYYNKLFSSSENISKGPKHPLIYQPKKIK
jgi:hypothetical protein